LQAEYDIIIIGAGAAGLMAAKELSKAENKRCLILEGRDRIGGRIHTIKYGDHLLEAGAEFIHGDLPLTKKLLAESGIESLKVGGKMYQSFRGDWSGGDDFGSGWGQLMRRMGELQLDMPLQEFLDQFFPEDKYASLRQSARGFAEGFDLANIEDASTMSLYKEWSHEQEHQYRIPAGYSSLVEWMAREIEAKGIPLLKNHCVKKVIWEKDYVRAITDEGREFSCKKLLITIPLPLLQNQTLPAAIHFYPPLTNQLRAAERIGFGKLIKLIFLFSEDFWEKSHEHLGFVFSDQPIPTWWTQLPQRNGQLTGWWGNPAIQKSEADEAVASLGIQSLAGIFTKQAEDIHSLLDSKFVFNWQKDIFSEGAYSYQKPGSGLAIEELKKPVDHCLFFAGEALFEGESLGTVEAALNSGREMAINILKSFT
jgi:monoamine oxidase